MKDLILFKLSSIIDKKCQLHLPRDSEMLDRVFAVAFFLFIF